jgi:transposase
MNMAKIEIDEDLLVQKYTEGLSYRELAKIFNCSHQTIKRRLKESPYKFKLIVRREKTI